MSLQCQVDGVMTPRKKENNISFEGFVKNCDETNKQKVGIGVVTNSILLQQLSLAMKITSEKSL